jgi:hypothetical protein
LQQVLRKSRTVHQHEEVRSRLFQRTTRSLQISARCRSLGFELRAWTDHSEQWMQNRSELAIALSSALAAEKSRFANKPANNSCIVVTAPGAVAQPRTGRILSGLFEAGIFVEYLCPRYFAVFIDRKEAEPQVSVRRGCHRRIDIGHAWEIADQNFKRITFTIYLFPCAHS